MRKAIILFIISFKSVFAQIPNAPVNVQSPNVVSFGIFGEIPTSNYTGIGNVDVPIASLDEGNIKFPVAYSQSTIGFKPDVHPGWVGLNGNLFGGGVVNRTVKGSPDDNPDIISISESLNYQFGFFYTFNRLNSNNWDSQASIVSNANLKQDEPDDFTFTCPAGNGKFYMTENGTIMVESEQNFKVDLYRSANGVISVTNPPFCRPQTIGNGVWGLNGYLRHMVGMKITDETGTEYHYGSETGDKNAIEYSIDFFSQRSDTWIANAWYLTKIIDKNGNKVDLAYDRKELLSQMYVSVSTQDKDVKYLGNRGFGSVWNECSSWSTSNTPPQGIYRGKLVSPVYLKEINGVNTKLVFNNSTTTELRYDQDIYETYYNWYALQGGSNLKYDIFPYLHSCVFDYNNLPTTIPCDAPTYCANEADIPTLLNRLQWRKLDNVQIYDKVSNTLKTQFNFSYTNNPNERLKLLQIKEVAFGPNIEKAPYIFNYYSDNIVTPPKYLKSHTDFWGFNNGIAINTASDFSNLDGSQNYVNYGPNLRVPNNNDIYLKLETLKSIIYPTGGKTEFEYEKHDYSKKVDEYGRWKPLVSSDGYGGGIRVKKATSYDPTTPNSKIEKEYFYIKNFNPSNGITTGTSSGILGQIAKYFVSAITTYSANRSQSRTLNNVFSTQSILATGENGYGSAIGYSEVVEKITSGGSSNGWNVYKYTNMESVSLSNQTTEPAHMDEKFQTTFQETTANPADNNGRTPYEPINSRASERGKLISKETFNTSGNPIAKSFFKYEALNSDYIRSVKANFFYPCTNFPQGSLPFYEGTAYKIFMYKFQLKNEINYTYDLTNSSNYVVSNSDYLYNFIGQISEKSTTVSEGTILINKSKYVPEYSDETSIACESFLTQCNSNCLESNTSPEDIASCQASCTTTYNNCNSAILEEPADAILKMKAKHIFALVESQTIKQIASNNFSTRGIITKFKDFGASGLQAKEIVTSEILQADTIRLSKINTSRVFSYDASYINSRLSFVGYDTKGNPLEINRKGTPTAYIWGYNQLLPIAEIKNANYTSAVTSIGAANLTSLNNDNLSDASVRSFTNLLRGLSNSLVTTYTHDRVFGLTSSTSPANITTFFGFDGLGRLGDVKDTDGKFLKKYAYSYDSPNIITSAMLREATTTESDADNYLKAIISNQYLNGLGQPIQTVNLKASGDASKDIVSGAVVYDIFARPAKIYIPFSNAGNGAVVVTANLPSANRPFSEVAAFENSPMNRALTTYGAGQTWFDNSKANKISYEVAANNSIRKYKITSTGFEQDGKYQSTLYKTVSTSEQGNEVTEYKDNMGKLVQKVVQLNASTTATTAYVYDEFDRIKYVIQPEGYNQASQVFDDTDLPFVFAYRYDNRSRIIEKKVPGTGWEQIIYDIKDRPVMKKTALQANGATKKWTYTKYDAFDREIESGETNNQSIQSTIQGLFNGQQNTNSYPVAIAGNEDKIKKIYDTQSGTLKTGNYGGLYGTYTGMLTEIQERNLTSNVLYVSNFFYDNKSRTVQIQEFNHLNNGGTSTISDFDYSFAGEVKNKKIRNSITGQPAIITELIHTDYDHMGRPISVTHQLNSQVATILATFEYDDLGRISKKYVAPGAVNYTCGGGVESKQTGSWLQGATWNSGVVPVVGDASKINTGHVVSLGTNELGYSGTLVVNGTLQMGTGSNVFLDGTNTSNSSTISIPNLQSIDYTYHIRGWLKAVNPTLKTNMGDLFSYNLDYETAGYYDGNIGKVTWKSPKTLSSCEMPERSYDFVYDMGSRLKTANYTSDISGENWTLPTISYDRNGNISTLQRKGKNSTSYGDIDLLTYTYTGNMLDNVKDDMASNENVGDFRDGNIQTATGLNDYGYWPDGSLNIDRNEGIEGITYDTFLKQSTLISLSGGRTIAHMYTGSGKLLRTTYSTGEYWDFVGNIILKNGTPFQIATPEGRMTLDNGSWIYEYDHKDHLGNTRVTFRKKDNKLEKVAISDFDPWGVKLAGNGAVNAYENRFEMQGHEKESTFGLNRINFGARTLNPTIGIFDSVDPLAAKNSHESPYSAMNNNPINVIDPDGQDGIRVVDLKNKTITIRANYYVQTASRVYQDGNKQRTHPGYSAKEISSMQTNYNKYLNDVGLNVSDGEYKGYTVKFDLQFKDGGTVEASQASAKADMEGGYSVGNSFTVGNDGVYPRFKTKEIDNGDGTTGTSTVGGVTFDNKDILMNSSQDTKMNRVHEVFHTLGFGHPKGTGGTGGIMKYPPDKPNQADINQVANGSFLPSIILKPDEKK